MHVCLIIAVMFKCVPWVHLSACVCVDHRVLGRSNNSLTTEKVKCDSAEENRNALLMEKMQIHQFGQCTGEICLQQLHVSTAYWTTGLKSERERESVTERNVQIQCVTDHHNRRWSINKEEENIYSNYITHRYHIFNVPRFLYSACPKVLRHLF